MSVCFTTKSFNLEFVIDLTDNDYQLCGVLSLDDQNYFDKGIEFVGEKKKLSNLLKHNIMNNTNPLLGKALNLNAHCVLLLT